MKLRNKKTGEIVEFDKFCFRKDKSSGWEDFVPYVSSLEELYDKWEDYEEPSENYMEEKSGIIELWEEE